jgi:capsid protein
MFSITSGIPYELLSGDYAKMNFSTLKVGRHDFKNQLIPEQSFYAGHYCQPIFYEWLKLEVLRGDIKLPLFSRPEIMLDFTWQPQEDKSIDLLRDMKSNIDAINARLKSPQQVIFGANGDPDDVISDFVAWNQMIADAGLNPEIDKISTALPNNPAAVANQKNIPALKVVNDSIYNPGWE